MFQPCRALPRTTKFLPLLAFCLLTTNFSAVATAQTLPEETPASHSEDLNKYAEEIARYAEPPPTYEPNPTKPPLAMFLIGGTPWGTHIERGRHMSFALMTASPPKFNGTFLTGFSYSERGSELVEYFAQFGAAASAQDQANRTGQTVYYEMPYDHNGTFGLSLEYLSAATNELGDTPYWVVAKLDNITYLGSDENQIDQDNMPFTLKWGLIFRAMSAAREVATDSPYSGMSFGIFLDFAFPVTRWAQLNAGVNAGFGNPVIEAALSATAHIGNRFFITAGSNMMEMDFGSFFRAGVRI